MAKDTRTDLVAELRRILPLTENFMHVAKIQNMIEEARSGEYHDYKNIKYSCGKVASHGLLQAIATPSALNLAGRIRNGEFDEHADEEDRRMLDGLVHELSHR